MNAHTEWADVTIAEFAALKLVASENAVARIDAYARKQFDAGKLPFNSEPPVLSEAGREWIESRRRRVTFCYRSNDATPARKLAREILSTIGTLTCLNA